MTFSEQIVYAMFKPSKYKELIKLKQGRFNLFVVVIMLVLGIVTFVIPAGATITGFGGFEKLFKNQLATIRYEDGGLKLDTQFRMKVNGLNIVMQTDGETVDDSELSKDGVYLAIGSKMLSFVTTIDGNTSHYQDMDISGLFDENFNCDSLVKFIPNIYIYMFVVFIFDCVGFFIKYAVMALLFGLFINTINKTMNMNMTFGEVFKLCFYGQTLGIIISNFNTALGLLPATVVSVICVFISVHMITTSVVFMNPRNQV